MGGLEQSVWPAIASKNEASSLFSNHPPGGVFVLEPVGNDVAGADRVPVDRLDDESIPLLQKGLHTRSVEIEGSIV